MGPIIELENQNYAQQFRINLFYQIEWDNGKFPPKVAYYLRLKKSHFGGPT